MGFSLSESVVEGNLFVRRDGGPFQGKWKYTIALDMRWVWDNKGTVEEAVLAAWQSKMFDGVLAEMADRDPGAADGYWLVVHEPYVKGGGYPVMVRV